MSTLMVSLYFIDAFPVNTNPATPPTGFVKPAAVANAQIFNGFFSRSATNATAWVWNTPFASGQMEVGFHLPVEPIAPSTNRGCALMVDPTTGNGYALAWSTSGLDVLIRSYLLTSWLLSTQLSTSTFLRAGFGNSYITMRRDNATGAMTVHRDATQLNSYTDATYSPNYGAAYCPAENGNLRSIEITDLASVIVDSFNGGDDVERGQSGLIYETSGLPSVTTITTDTAGVTVGNISDTAGDGTCDISDYTEAGLYPVLPTDVIFTLGDGTDSANITKTLTILPTESSVITSGLITINSSYMGFHLLANGRSVADGGQFVWPITADFTLYADGSFNYAAVGSVVVPVWYIDPSNGRSYLFTGTFGDGDIIIVPGDGLTSVGATSIGLTSTGLTSVGL